MQKVDVGSGYNPAKGYRTCDINYNCDYHDITEIKNVDIIRLKNVIHHVEDISAFFKDIYRCLNKNGRIIIIEPSEKNYRQNFFLDRLWYRGINKRLDIYISENYRNYLDEIQGLFKIKKSKERGYKLWTILSKV